MTSDICKMTIIKNSQIFIDNILEKILDGIFLYKNSSSTRPNIYINSILWRAYGELCKKKNLSSTKEIENWLNKRLKKEILKNIDEEELKKLLSEKEFHDVKTLLGGK